VNDFIFVSLSAFWASVWAARWAACCGRPTRPNWSPLEAAGGNWRRLEATGGDWSPLELQTSTDRERERRVSSSVSAARGQAGGGLGAADWPSAPQLDRRAAASQLRMGLVFAASSAASWAAP